MSYASYEDVALRTTRTFDTEEQAVICALLEDAAAMIDAAGSTAPDAVKLVVSCRMVLRAMGGDETAGVPIGATQGSMGAGGYTQSWTVGGGGSAGELYLGKADRQLLGLSSRIGILSPLEGMVDP